MLGGIGALFAAVFGVIWTIFSFKLTEGMPFPWVHTLFPLFGVVFVLMGISMAIYNFVNAGSKDRMSMVDITTSEEEPDPLNQIFGRKLNPSGGESVEAKLVELVSLKQKGLISEAEYTSQRERILNQI